MVDNYTRREFVKDSLCLIIGASLAQDYRKMKAFKTQKPPLADSPLEDEYLFREHYKAIRAPESFGKLVEGQVRKIYERGLANKIGENGLSQFGRMILQLPVNQNPSDSIEAALGSIQNPSDSIGTVLKSTQYILYRKTPLGVKRKNGSVKYSKKKDILVDMNGRTYDVENNVKDNRVVTDDNPSVIYVRTNKSFKEIKLTLPVLLDLPRNTRCVLSPFFEMIEEEPNRKLLINCFYQCLDKKK